MIDQDSCEWVYVLLVLAHPGSPRRNRESHKMVIRVCTISRNH